MYGPIRGRSIPWRTVRRRPCSWLRFPGLRLRSAGLRLRPGGLCLCWTRGLGTCRRLLGTAGVGSPGSCRRCRTIAGLGSSALGRPGLPVVLRLLRTILGVRRGWQRPDETTSETAEGWPGQQPERSCLHRYGFPFRCWKNVARVGAYGGEGKAVRRSACVGCSIWADGHRLPGKPHSPVGAGCAEREIRFRIKLYSRREKRPWQFRRWPAFRR